MEVRFEVDTADLVRQLNEVQRERIPSVIRNTLNHVAKEARLGEVKRIRGAFDRPTRFITSSPRYEEATKENLVAHVLINDAIEGAGVPPSKVLAAEVRGGDRRPKAFELILRRGGYMGADEYAVPARGIALDKNGNFPRSLLLRVLRDLGQKRRRGLRYFVPRPTEKRRGLARGVWEERARGEIRPILIFVKNRPTYRRKYPFGDATVEAVQRKFAPAFVRYFNAEMRYVATGSRYGGSSAGRGKG